jgi:hypothetical protein
MLNRTVAGLIVALLFTGSLLADETRGGITKIEDDTLTMRTMVVNGGFATFEEKKFKIDKDVQIIRVKVRGMEEAKLTLDDLKKALKDGKVSARITHDGEKCTVIKVIPPGFGG